MKELKQAYSILSAPLSDSAWKIAVSLSKSPKTVYELESDTGLAQTAVSTNLTRLRGANLVEFKREGKGSKYKRYSINESGFMRIHDTVKRLI